LRPPRRRAATRARSPSARSSTRLRLDLEEWPSAGDAFQRPFSSTLEFDVGSGHEEGHDSGDPDLPRIRVLHDSRRDVNGDTADVGATQLDFAGVDAGAEVNCESAQRVSE